MMIDGVECEVGERVLFRSIPTRLQRLIAWIKSALGIRTPDERWNTVWRVANGSWEMFPNGAAAQANGVYQVHVMTPEEERADEERRARMHWLRPTLLNRAFVWLMAWLGIEGFGIEYYYDDE